MPRFLEKKDILVQSASVLASILTAVLTYTHFGGAVVALIMSAIALALLASVVGKGTEHLGSHVGPAATGILHSALGNLPELLIGIFSLRAGLIEVVQAALIGSILSNSLLVLGFAFLLGGIKNGRQCFEPGPPRVMSTLILVAVTALAIPTIADHQNTPAKQHTDELSLICAFVLLVVFASSVYDSFKTDSEVPRAKKESMVEGTPWPLPFTIVVLAISGLLAGFVSDWFVEALQPSIKVLHLSQAFTGLVIVSIAGNAVENFVGIQMAMKNRPDFAVSVIMNSSLQIAIGLIPTLVIASFLLGGTHLTLILPPLLVAALFISVLASAFVAFDGESIWLEGMVLIGLYVIIAAAFWWG